MGLAQTLRFITTHPLTKDAPMAALWRFVRWQVESRLRDEVVVDWVGGAKLAARNGMTGATGNIYCGLHEFNDMAFLLHFLRPGDVFVDAGANIGSYTVLASAVCGATTIAFEPDSGTMRALKRNIEVNDISAHVITNEVALGKSEGEVAFTFGRDTTNRVAQEEDEPAQTVRLRALDNCLGEFQPAIIKFDVEGYEAQALAGSVDILNNPSLLAIQIETVDHDVVAMLESIGFAQYAYHPFRRTLSLNSAQNRSANLLFIREAEACVKRVKTAQKFSILGKEI